MAPWNHAHEARNAAGVSSEMWAFDNRRVLRSIHESYVQAGSDIILACTFGGSRFHLGDRCAW